MSIKSPFRYPGSKSKFIVSILENLKVKETYTEPFVGGGSVALAVAEKYPNTKIFLNDLDEWIYAFWKIISNGDIQVLSDMLDQPVTLDTFYNLRESPDTDEINKAYKAIFFNRTTFSGILRSGPIGGKSQLGKYKIDCRYNKEKLKIQLINLRRLLEGRTIVTNKDVIEMNFEGSTYLDPPYFLEGSGLYRKNIDHIALANKLRQTGNWLLSYDDCPEIRTLYMGCKFIDINARYSVSVSKLKNELLILP